MSRKTILKVTSILSCSILAMSLGGCKDSESEQAAKDTLDSLNKSNRLITSGSEQVTLTADELAKIKAIPGDLTGEQLALERKRLASEIAQRLATTAGDSILEEVSAEITALSQSEIKTAEDFEKVCAKLIEISNKIVELTEKSSGKERKEQRSEAALVELGKAQAAITKSLSDNDRRQTLLSATALSFATIYSSKARAEHEQLGLRDLDVHNILMAINGQVDQIRRSNNDILAAKESRPEKALVELSVLLDEAKASLADVYDRLNKNKKQYSEYEAKYKENLEKANYYRDKYLQALSDADKASGSERYRLEMEATLQRVGKENLQEWASQWLADGGDSEMGLFVNSSKQIVGGIYYENLAEMARLQMESIDTQTKVYAGMVETNESRIKQLEVVIDNLKTAPETTSDIERRINAGEQAKNAAIDKVKALQAQLTAFEAEHSDQVNLIAEQYQQAGTNMNEYIQLSRPFGEFDPQNFKKLLDADLARLYENDVTFYKTVISAVENMRSIPELAEDSLDLIKEYEKKAEVSEKAAEAVKPEPIIKKETAEEVPSEVLESDEAPTGEDDSVTEEAKSLSESLEGDLLDAIDELNGEPNDSVGEVQ